MKTQKTTKTATPTDAASLQFSVTVKGETRALLEKMDEGALRPLLAQALVTAINKAAEPTPGAQPVPGKTFKRAIVAKADATGEERYVLGIVMEPDEVDTQGDTQTADTVRKAAFAFMEAYRGGGDAGHMGLMHKQLVDGKVAILESYLQKADETMGDEAIKAGSWLMGVRVMDDDLWAAVKKGDLTGFSIGGTAVKTPAD